ncbi:uncharacterized protein LOC124420309 [Lucilia cuprina]|uniref:uncharacterized protein LOC124420309 n=1 Tax=Lucilia cuprina TaxID=7375 RepID=UPI001F067D47|nr:uncharacterized protein LOC124420309 [Lucilia cuprina]
MNSTTRKETSPKERFVFECDHLLQFCQRFNSTAVEDQTESLLEVKLKDIDSRWTKVEASYENVMLAQEDLVPPEFKEQAKTNFDACVDAYYTCISQMLDLQKAFRIDAASHIQGIEAVTRYSLPPQNLVSENPNNCIKLPPCDTEVFKGSYEQWPSFRDMFTAVYINHSKLSPVTKLYHLRNKTKGEAGDIVKRYPLSHENFELAWNALKTRYENKRVLVDNQIKILFNIPPVTREDSNSIRRIQSSVNDSLATLRTLGIEVDSWDPILIRLISTKLPDFTLSLWEQSLSSPRELPKWSQMSQFLVDRYEAVERLTSIRTSKDSFNITENPQQNIQTYTSQENLNIPFCKLCSENHSLRICPKFRTFAVQQRVDYVFKNKFCNTQTHLKAKCKSKNTCLMCKKSHHTLLHMKQKFQNDSQRTENSQPHEASIENVSFSRQSASNKINSEQNKAQNELPTVSTQVQANFSTSNENILLRTALVQIEYQGQLYTVRALIDPGSQRTFLTEKIRNRLQLPYNKSHFEIIGIGGQKQSASKECEFVLYAKRYNLRVPIKAIILPKVTKWLPSHSFEIANSKELAELDLADPTFNKTSQVDLILGNDYEHFLNIEGIKKNICGQASAYNTVFGWVLSGPMKTKTIQSFTTSVLMRESSELNEILKKFWEQEEIPTTRPVSVEHDFCEKYYVQTTTRNEEGRYIVRLPFRKEFPEKVFLGSSRFVALAQFSYQETLNFNHNTKQFLMNT